MYIYIYIYIYIRHENVQGGIGKFDSWYKNLNYVTKQRNEERKRERIKRFHEHTRDPKLNGCERA